MMSDGCMSLLPFIRGHLVRGMGDGGWWYNYSK